MFQTFPEIHNKTLWIFRYIQEHFSYKNTFGTYFAISEER